MAEHDEVIARVVEALKEPVHIDASLDGRIMAEIERGLAPEATTSVTRSLSAWLRRPRTFRVSPLGGLAIAAGLAAVVLLGSRLAGRAGEPDVMDATVRAQPIQRVQFVLVAPEAESVTLVGDFNDWSLSATPLERAEGDGVWWITIPLSPGRYRYSFVVDGTMWLEDPNAPAVEDEFGRANSVVTIGGA